MDFKWNRGDQPPEHEARVLCITRTQKGRLNYVLGYYCHHLAVWATGMNTNVVFWAELPDFPEDLPGGGSQK